MPPLDLGPAAREVIRLLDGVRQDQLGDPTPCAGTSRISVTLLGGKVAERGLDRLGRLTGVVFRPSAAAAAAGTVAVGYDGVGRVTRVVDSAAGTYTQVFDDLDQLTAAAGPQGRLDYAYDAAGNRVSATVAGRAAVGYGYDPAGRLTGVTRGAAAAAFGYDGLGRLARRSLPNGTSQDYGYDPDEQVTSIGYRHGAAVLGDLTYGYDDAGRVSHLGGSWARTSLPDPVDAGSYDDANRISRWAGTSYTWDGDGNLTGDGTSTYSWDTRGRLAGVTGAGLSAAFGYDPFGRRTSRTVNGTTTGYLYDGDNAVQEHNAAGAVTADLLNGRGVDDVLSRTDDAATVGYLSDLLASTVALTDDTGTVATSYTYTPFGQGTADGGSSTNSRAFANQQVHLGGVLEPAQHQRGLGPAGRRPLPGPGVGAAAVGLQRAGDPGDGVDGTTRWHDR